MLLSKVIYPPILSIDIIPDGFGAERPQRDVLEGLDCAGGDSCNTKLDRRVNSGTIEQRVVDYRVRADHQWFHVNSSLSDNGFVVKVDQRRFHVRRDWHPGQRKLRVLLNGTDMVVQLDRDGFYWWLSHRGHTLHMVVLRPRVAELLELMPEKCPPDTGKLLLSPMPGLLVRLLVSAGDEVQAGQALAVVEAMKMENVLFAERVGVIASTAVQPGESLSVDQIILEFE